MNLNRSTITAGLLASTLAVTQATAVEAKEVSGEIDDVISQSVYFVPQTGELSVNEQQVRDAYPDVQIEESVFTDVRSQLKALSDDEVDNLLVENGYDPAEVRVADGEATANAAPIVWLVVGGIAALGAGALIFTSMYFSHKEKTELINRCYETGGNPVVDSRDQAGVSGQTKSDEAQADGGYKFECRK